MLVSCVETCAHENEAECGQKSTPPMSLLTARIDTLNLHTRSYNALVGSFNYTIGDVVRYTERDLLAIDGLGRRSVDALKKTLASRGLALGSHRGGIPQ